MLSNKIFDSSDFSESLDFIKNILETKDEDLVVNNITLWAVCYLVESGRLWSDYKSGVLLELFDSLPFELLMARYDLPDNNCMLMASLS